MPPKPTPLMRRGALIALLVAQGIARKCVEKWLREGIIPPHQFPGLKKRKGQRAYFCLATVEQTLGINLQTRPPTS